MRTFLLLPITLVTLLYTGDGRMVLHGQELPFHNYTIADGLISDNITDVCEDSLGFIWVATSDGLSRFDSKDFVNYTTTNGLASSNISCVTADRGTPGVIWIGTDHNGVDCFSEGAFRNYPVDTIRDQRGVNVLFQDSTGRIWGGTDQGLFYIERNSRPKNFRWLSNISISSIYGPPRGKIMAATSAGVFSLEGMDRPPIHFDCPATGEGNINGIFVDSQNNLWISKRDGTIVLCKNCNPIQYSQIHNIDGPTRFSEGAQHKIWISTRHGLLATTETDFERGIITRIDKRSGLQEEDLNSVMVDHEGVIWMSSYRSGLTNIVSTDLIRFNFKQKRNRMWSSVVCDGFGHFWVTDGEALMELFKGSAGVFEMVEHPLPPLSGTDQLMKLAYNTDQNELLFAYGDGRILISNISHHGNRPSTLVRTESIDLKRFENFDWLQTICLDSQGNLWCSLLDRGVAMLNHEYSAVARLYISGNGLPDNSVRAIFRDNSGSTWFGGFAHGLTKVPQKQSVQKLKVNSAGGAPQISFYSTENGLPDNAVRAITQGENEDLLVGTRYGGLAILRGDSIMRIGRTQGGLMSDGIWSLQPLPDKRVLVCTQAGVQEMFLGKQIEFTTLDGVPKIPYYSSSLSKEGYACFASGEAAFIYDVRERADLHESPPIYLTRVLADGKEMNIEMSNTLPSNTRSITFDFVEITNKTTDRIYQYRLVGIDEVYHTVSDKNSITYAGLRPGKYMFEVYGLNGNIRSANTASFAFTIKTPFYAAWYFITLSVCTIILVAILFVRQRLNSLSEVRRIRQRIAMDLHDEIGSGLTKIAMLSDYASSEWIPSKHKTSEIESTPQTIHANETVVESPVDRIGRIARGMVDSIADVVWSIDPRYDTLTDFIINFRSYANELAEARGISMSINERDLDKVKIDSQVKRVLQLFSKEALNNAIKYSGCKNITYDLEVRKGKAFLSFQDDGCGFDINAVELGNGINNMKKHAREVNGNIAIESSPHHGTKILFEFPLKA